MEDIFDRLKTANSVDDDAEAAPKRTRTRSLSPVKGLSDDEEEPTTTSPVVKSTTTVAESKSTSATNEPMDTDDNDEDEQEEGDTYTSDVTAAVDENDTPKMKKCRVKLPRCKPDKFAALMNVSSSRRTPQKGRGRPKSASKPQMNGNAKKSTKPTKATLKIGNRNAHKTKSTKIFVRPASISPPVKRGSRLQPIVVLNRKALAKMYDKRFFRCHVNIVRSKLAGGGATKKKKTNNKCVSFDETVEVIGDLTDSDESDDDDPDFKSGPTKQRKLENGKVSGNGKLYASTPMPESKGSKKSFSPLRPGDGSSSRKRMLKRGDERMPVKSLLLDEEDDDDDAEWIVPTEVPKRKSASPPREPSPSSDAEEILPDVPSENPTADSIVPADEVDSTVEPEKETPPVAVEKETSPVALEKETPPVAVEKESTPAPESTKTLEKRESDDVEEISSEEGETETAKPKENDIITEIIDDDDDAEKDEVCDNDNKLLNESQSKDDDVELIGDSKEPEDNQNVINNDDLNVSKDLFYSDEDKSLKDVEEVEDEDELTSIMNTTKNDETPGTPPTGNKLNSFFQSIKAKILSPNVGSPKEN